VYVSLTKPFVKQTCPFVEQTLALVKQTCPHVEQTNALAAAAKALFCSFFPKLAFFLLKLV
jgi:hypothetical protein